MHRTIPNYVETNHLRTNFYDDEKNEPIIIEGLKFMNKIDPNLVRSIPLAKNILHDAIRKENRQKAQKMEKVNIFAGEQELENDNPKTPENIEFTSDSSHDVFGEADLTKGMMHIQTLGGRRISVPKKFHPDSKSSEKRKRSRNSTREN